MKLPKPEARLMNNLKVLRAIHDVTQEELALGIGVTKKTISTVETGTYVPSTVLTLKLARYFGVPVEDVFALPEQEREDGA